MDEFLRHLIDSVNDAIVAIDAENNVVEWNRAAEGIFGFSRDEALGRNLDQLIGGGNVGEAKRITGRIIRKGERVADLQTVRYRKDGSPVPVQISASPVMSGRKIVSAVAIYRDVSEQKKREELLLHYSRLLRAISDINQTIIQEGDPERLLGKCCRILARTGKYEFVRSIMLDEGRNPVRFIAAGRESSRETLLPCELKVIENRRSLFIPEVEDSSTCRGCGLRGAGWAAVFLLVHKKEVFGLLHVAKSPGVFNQAQEVKLLEEISHDLGFALFSIRKQREKERFEKELADFKEFLEKVLSSLAEGVLVEDEQGMITYANPSMEKMLGYARGGLNGRHWSVVISPEELDRVKEKSARRRSKTLETYESLLQAGDGRKIPVLIHARSLFDGLRFRGVVSAVTDITELKKTQEELRASREAALAASRAKSEFLANMSHEIRTPMNGVIGMIELALQTSLSDEQKGFLSGARASAESLLTVLNDILDFSKIEARMVEFNPAEFNLPDSVTEIVSTLSLVAHKKGLELNCRVDPGLPRKVVGDVARLRQVIVNLVSNAIKFTERGEVSVDVKEAARDDGAIVLHFSVRDTGIGIPEEKQKTIFQPFVQADNSTSRRYGGTGLGLAISSQLVEMMSGRIWVVSRPGEGSTFHFTARLDVPKGRAGLKPEKTPEELRGLRVLAVDDNDTNRLIIKEMVASWDFEVTAAASGREALELIEADRKQGRRFNLVILDVNMPEMDGFTLLRKIRADADYADCPVIVLTSADRLGDVRKVRQLRASGYLVKPAKPSELFDLIITAVSDKGKPAAGAKPAAAEATEKGARPSSYEILLAEDNPVNQKVATLILEKRGHKVTVVPDGRQAVEALGRGRFDLVLMDVQMPELDGYAATAEIRKMEGESGGHIPIVAMTAHAMKGDREKCLAAGMDDYISKPIYPEELYRTMERVMREAAKTAERGS
jgi:PAS domain S-box-containing protein